MGSSQLVDELGVLLQALHLPIILESPMDLTPSLLLAILESILASRLPLSPHLRNALLSNCSTSKEAKNAKIQCMKIFLGVIETDILKTDAGLSRIDPKKLANGDWDEVVYVGQILCWIGKEFGITEDYQDRVELQAWRLTPSTAPDVSDTSISHPSSSSLPTADTTRSLHDLHDLRSLYAPSSSPSSRVSPLVIPRSRRPRCIHEVSSLYAQDAHDTQDVTTLESETSSVRYSGYIQPVDEELELSYFESSRSNKSLGDRENIEIDVQDDATDRDFSALADLLDPDPLARTITLLQQRAFLLGELAKYHAKRT
ncbi:hypothetical protein J3R30DRAFT_1222803 [Lentinula aciculospora]|uniref:Uncharacterized protein n=1 Tax=Lentinula aciculospora TaxID=153920 RepID=A0A9W9A0G1_9AGAR|nr:hypothetical protein J3R30DRAFT_1222803 [Lentinula aciculospora]